MSGCSTNPCAPVNPCDCAETADIREQGPPGGRGLPGGIPVFQIGATVSGPVPSVTLTMVNPLLYTLDFIIPSVGTNLPNTWSATQTFSVQTIFSDGFAASGSSTIVDLTVSGTLQAALSIFTGLSTFNGNTVFNGTNDFQGDTTFVNATVNGDFKMPNLAALGAGQAVLGTVVAKADGTFAFTVGAANSASGSTALAATIVFNASETAIAFNLPFVVPAGPDALCVVVAQMTVNYSGANPPADISNWYFRCRLDNPTIGAQLGINVVSNFEGSVNLNAQVTVPAGAHTLYFTIQGSGLGSSSLTLTNIEARVNF